MTIHNLDELSETAREADEANAFVNAHLAKTQQNVDGLNKEYPKSSLALQTAEYNLRFTKEELAFELKRKANLESGIGYYLPHTD